ncbi:Hypothetical_protein [Hexamita inflata]|uniref:Hypothetical_protein n=1 Tax=Hexamita inflata TaxID=28002 RepID=A0AA86QG02_9EUKA|nr:Hypothetical protein HINF_LOCUS46236 [Hexamita inflata]
MVIYANQIKKLRNLIKFSEYFWKRCLQLKWKTKSDTENIPNWARFALTYRHPGHFWKLLGSVCIRTRVGGSIRGYVVTLKLKQNDSLSCNLISTKAQFNHSIFISQIMKIHLVTQKCYLKLISISYLIFQDCHSEQPHQTTQVSSTLILLTSEVIFVTIFGMTGMNLGTSVSAATRASKFRGHVRWQNIFFYFNDHLQRSI